MCRSISTQTGLKENPYLIGCPCCGVAICSKCAGYEEKTSPDGLCGCSECVAYVRRVNRAWTKHLGTYDHTFVNAEQQRHRERVAR
jgi:hypothetical protein